MPIVPVSPFVHRAPRAPAPNATEVNNKTIIASMLCSISACVLCTSDSRARPLLTPCWSYFPKSDASPLR